jgi:hypothetical protein
MPELIRFCSRIETSGRVVVHPTIETRHINKRGTVLLGNGMKSPPPEKEIIYGWRSAFFTFFRRLLMSLAKQPAQAVLGKKGRWTVY